MTNLLALATLGDATQLGSFLYVLSIDIEDKNRLLKVCYVPATSASHPRLLFDAAINSTYETNKAGSTHH
jgi:hypothetical protein